MKKHWLLAIILASLAVSTQAQTRPQPIADPNPKAELYLGYAYMSIDGQEFVKRQHGHGWNGSIAGNFHRNIGFVADFGGHYGHVDLPGIGSSVSAGVDYRLHTGMIGPRFYQRFEKATPFFHVLFGIADTRIPNGPVVLGSSRNPFLSGSSTTDFAMGIGGGVDYNISRGVSLRIFQLDYIPVRAEPTMHNLRGSVGFVFKFGE
jgi:opacity protein-like surface antigen